MFNRPNCQPNLGRVIAFPQLSGLFRNSSAGFAAEQEILTEKKATGEGGLNARRVTGGRDLCKGLIHQQCQ
jgi:hypothetical protein